MHIMLIMKYIIITLIILIIIYVINNISKNNFDKEKSYIIKIILRQSARWSTAAQQDENPMVAVLHANYGAGYLWALKDVFSDREIEDFGHIDILKFRDEITKVQDEATVKMIKVCPEFGPKKTYLTEIAKES